MQSEAKPQVVVPPDDGENLDQLQKRKAELEQELENQKKTEQNRKNRQAQKEKKRLA